MRTIARRSLFGLLAVALMPFLPADAADPAYPAKPVRIVVPFAAGGGVDILTRVLAQHLSDRLGQQVLVENRPGAGGNVGVDAVAKSAPDGYTLVMGTTGTHAINPGLYPNLAYDPLRDFKPITLVASVPNLLVVNPSVKVESLKELIALAKSRPGQLNFGSFGNGTSNHLSGELLKSAAGVDITHVPYKSAPQGVSDLIAGELSLMFVNMPLALPHVQSGKLRALAVTGSKRSSTLPDLPTMIEAGLPDYQVESWYGLLAPAGTPDDIVTRLHRETVAVLDMPAVKEFFAKQGAEPVTSSSAELERVIAGDMRQWSEVIKRSGARVD